MITNRFFSKPDADCHAANIDNDATSSVRRDACAALAKHKQKQHMSNTKPTVVQWHHASDATTGNPVNSRIVLTTLNARFIHASLGLRYLYANMGALQQQTVIQEFTTNARVPDIAEQLLASEPGIIGIGVYIWNIRESTELVQLIKTVSPETIVVIGGPEVSFEFDETPIYHSANYLITGQADLAFAILCQQLFSQQAPAGKLINAANPAIAALQLPYRHYSDADLKNRIVYVEASRGCPFKCEFCLSSLDKTAWPFELDRFLNAMDELYQRGLRHFKFVDRTFNLKVSNSSRILAFFLERANDGLFLHFEVIPDKLPDALKEMLVRFPPGVLQFEVGIQTFNPKVQATINRKQDNQASLRNLRWLIKHTHAHIHADLIFGLPGESYASIGKGFDALWRTGVQEVQAGLLKRLKGTPITRLTERFGMRYSPTAPYSLMASENLSFTQMQRLGRFSRYWDLISNSGRYHTTLQLLLGDSPFEHFMQFTDWCFSNKIPTHGLQPHRVMDLLYQALRDLQLANEDAVLDAITRDFSHYEGKPPNCLASRQLPQKKIERIDTNWQAKRQQRHRQSNN